MRFFKQVRVLIKLLTVSCEVFLTMLNLILFNMKLSAAQYFLAAIV